VRGRLFPIFLKKSEEFLQNVAVIQRKKLFLQSVIAINLYHDMKIRVRLYVSEVLMLL
jgi:hypothetical protein